MVSRPRPDQPERQIWRLLERIDRLETMVYGRSSSVTNGRTRFAGNESILVEGSGKVEGWWIVTGTQRTVGRHEGSGTLDWTGPWFLRGVGQVTGNLSLTGNITVLPGGKIQVGDMVIDPANGGSVTFPGIGAVRADSNGVRIEAGNTFAVVRQGYAYLGLPGQSFSVDGLNGPRVQGMPTRSSTTTDIPIGGVGTDSDGYLYRVVL